MSWQLWVKVRMSAVNYIMTSGFAASALQFQITDNAERQLRALRARLVHARTRIASFFAKTNINCCHTKIGLAGLILGLESSSIAQITQKRMIYSYNATCSITFPVDFVTGTNAYFYWNRMFGVPWRPYWIFIFIFCYGIMIGHSS